MQSGTASLCISHRLWTGAGIKRMPPAQISRRQLGLWGRQELLEGMADVPAAFGAHPQPYLHPRWVFLHPGRVFLHPGGFGGVTGQAGCCQRLLCWFLLRLLLVLCPEMLPAGPGHTGCAGGQQNPSRVQNIFHALRSVSIAPYLPLNLVRKLQSREIKKPHRAVL